MIDAILSIDPAMLVFLEQLQNYGAAYHSSMDFLEFVDRDNKEARMHRTVSLWSPCAMLQPLRAFSTNDIVGVCFEACAKFFKQMDIDPLHIENANGLLDLYQSRVPQWVRYMFRDKQLDIPDRLLQAQEVYERVRKFFAAHPESAKLPEPVRKIWVDAWRAKISPSPSVH